MSDKEKQIEEMAKTICARCLESDPCVSASNGRVCDSAMAEANCLYNAGYRKLGECENIGTVHPVDEFKCSVCGITLEGWTRVVTDEDDGELYYYEYEFRYCPNCGARMKGGDV